MSEQKWPERKIEVEEIRCPAHGSPEWFPSLNYDGIECDQCESRLMIYVPSEPAQTVARSLREHANALHHPDEQVIAQFLREKADQLTSPNRGSDDG